MGVTPASTLVVEDSVPGVQAGAAAGTTVVGFTGGSHVVDKRAHGERLRAEGALLILDDMARLPDLLAGAHRPVTAAAGNVPEKLVKFDRSGRASGFLLMWWPNTVIGKKR